MFWLLIYTAYTPGEVGQVPTAATSTPVLIPLPHHLSTQILTETLTTNTNRKQNQKRSHDNPRDEPSN